MAAAGGRVGRGAGGGRGAAGAGGPESSPCIPIRVLSCFSPRRVPYEHPVGGTLVIALAAAGSWRTDRVTARARPTTPDLERKIRTIRDPELRAARAVEAHREARELASKLSVLRRDSILELHEAGRTWQEVADAVGLSLKATVKAVHGAGDPGQWWKRLPTDVAQSVKRGPGGRKPTHLIPRQALMDTIVGIMGEAERASRKLGRGAARVTPADLAQRSAERFGKPVSMPSLRNALHTLIEEGRVARVGHGRYVLVQQPTPPKLDAPAAKARRAREGKAADKATRSGTAGVRATGRTAPSGRRTAPPGRTGPSAPTKPSASAR